MTLPNQSKAERRFRQRKQAAEDDAKVFANRSLAALTEELATLAAAGELTDLEPIIRRTLGEWLADYHEFSGGR